MSKLNVLVRTDASVSIGTGHVMRCLTLADALREEGGDVSFASVRQAGDLSDYIKTRGYHTYDLVGGIGEWQQDAAQTAALLASLAFNCLVVDHYNIDARWESLMRPYVRRMMVIDDLANRRHDCDLLLDQNYYKAMESRYNDLVPGACLKLLGPRYALLRREFREMRLQMRVRDGAVKRILIFMGGADAMDATTKAIQAVALLARPEISVDVVIGGTNPNRERIQALCQEQPNIRLHIQVNNMAQLMASADLCVGAGGATMWERCLLGLPTLTLICADNQQESTQDVADTGALRYLGRADQLTTSSLARAMAQVIDSPDQLAMMTRCAMAVMDGYALQGVPPVVSAMHTVVAQS